MPPLEIPIRLPVDVLILWKEPNLVREGGAIVMEGTRNISLFSGLELKSQLSGAGRILSVKS